MRNTWLAFIALGLAGCISVTSTALNPSPRPLFMRPAASVEVLSSGEPARPHVDYALLHVLANDTTAGAVASLREQAGKLGCDAIVLKDMNPAETSWYATCVVYSDGGVAQH